MQGKLKDVAADLLTRIQIEPGRDQSSRTGKHRRRTHDDLWSAPHLEQLRVRDWMLGFRRGSQIKLGGVKTNRLSVSAKAM